jgi:hypothetical protein
MDHQVEFWIAENVLSAAPADTSMLKSEPPVEEMQACVVQAHMIDRTGRSPVDLHRR